MLSGLTAVARVRGIVTAKLTRLKPTKVFLGGVDIVRYEVCAVVVVTIASNVIVIVAAVVITAMA